MKNKSNKEVKMKIWIIASMLVVLAIGGFFAVNALQDDTTKTPTTTGCGKCNGSCTAENNCGLAGCGAVNGGECTCNKSDSCSGGCSAGTGSCGSAGCGVEKTGSCGCNK